MMRTLLLFFVLVFQACATVPKGDLELLKPTIESFHRQARWRDFRAVADLLVPQKRDGFLAARKQLKDDRDLFITDYELEEAKISDDRLKAAAVSHIKWYRLPSVTEEDSLVTSNWIWKDAGWWLDSQDGGPFASELKLSSSSTR